MTATKEVARSRGRPQRKDVSYFDPRELVIVGIDTPHKRNEHPLWRASILKPLDSGKVDHVRKHGVKLTVVARKNGDKLELVDGRNRTRWARAATEQNEAEGSDVIVRVPVLIVKEDDANAAALSVALNKVREDVPPSEDAKDAQWLLDMGLDKEVVAASFGLKWPMLKKKLKLLDLVPEVRQQVDAGDLTIAKGAEISREPREKQAEKAKAHREAPKKPTASKQLKTTKSRVEKFEDLVKKAVKQEAHGSSCLKISSVGRKADCDCWLSDAEKLLS